MDEKAALVILGVMANETRLKMVRCLVQAGETGLSAGEVAKQVGATPSRASFHLSAMAEAGLVTVTRQARSMIYRVRFEAIGGLAAYLLQDCCQGSPKALSCCGFAVGR